MKDILKYLKEVISMTKSEWFFYLSLASVVISILIWLEVPLFGLIYYPLIDPSLKGGELLFKDGTTIMPRSNRMVLFSTGTIFHKVAEYDDGQRLSFIVNIWDKKFLGEV